MTTPRLRLITIAVSHFCEKARWGLDRVGANYREEAHAPILHWGWSLRHAGQRTVPVLITPHGTLRTSTAILKHLDGWVQDPHRLYASDEVDDLEARFDTTLGVWVRRWVYGWVVDDLPLFHRLLAAPTIGRAERLAFRSVHPAVAALLRRALRLSPASRDRMYTKLRGLFDEVSERLADGRRYLTGDRFTAADLTFCALAAPAVLASGYGAPLPGLADLPAAMRPEVTALQETAAGRLVHRVYDEERRRVIA